MKILLFLLCSVPLLAHADLMSDAGRCQTITNPESRLSCYDQVFTYYQKFENNITTRSDSAGSSKLSPDNSPTKNPQRSELSSADAAAQVTPSVQAQISLPQVSPEERFGKSSQNDDIDHISSRIVGQFKGWKKGVILRLENGQHWKVISANSGQTNQLNPKVVISKGSLGSFLMKVEGLNSRARVRRKK